jgi:WD40 repeat protein
MATLGTGSSYVNALACSPDGRLLASASGDQTIRIWDWKEKRSLMTLRGHLSEVLDVAFAPDGQTLASGCKDGTVFMWNVASNRDERTYHFLRIYMRDWSFAPDSRIIVGLDASGAVRSWTTADLQENRRFEALGTDNTSFALSKSGTWLAVGTRTGRVHVINLLTDVETGTFTVGSGGVMVLGFAAEENLLLTHDQDRVVSLCDIRSGLRKHQWQVPEPFQNIQLARAADVLATQAEGQLMLWRTKDGQRLWTAKAGDELYRMEFSHDGKIVAIASGKGLTKLFDTLSGAESTTLSGFLLGTHSVAFSPDDQRLAIGSNGKEAVKVWDTELRQEVLTLEGQGSLFMPTAFSPDGRVLASTSGQGLHLWRAPSWEEIEKAEAEAKKGEER